MGSFRALVEVVSATEPSDGAPDPDPGLDEVRARAAGHADVTRLIDLVARDKRCFAFGLLEIHPRVFTRLARHPGVLAPSELVIGHDGGGDLYLFDAITGRARRVVHDEGWVTRGEHASLDALMERIAWVSLESIEPDEVEELLARPGARRALDWALGIASDALHDETRDALREAGVIEE